MSLISRFQSSFRRLKERNWDKIYVAVDIHETIFHPCYYNEETFNYYPLAKKCLQMLSEREDVCLILWTSSWRDTANQTYRNHFQRNKILFRFVNENPECENTDLACFDEKFYFDVGIDDRFGFQAKYEWVILYLYLLWLKKKKKVIMQ